MFGDLVWGDSSIRFQHVTDLCEGFSGISFPSPVLRTGIQRDEKEKPTSEVIRWSILGTHHGRSVLGFVSCAASELFALTRSLGSGVFAPAILSRSAGQVVTVGRMQGIGEQVVRG